jgi:hemophore-related protein
MKTLSLTKLAVAVGGLSVALTTGAGIASAQPDASAIINSTCTYPQVMAALNAEDPQMAGQVSSNPALVAGLQNLIASGPEGRRQTVAQWQDLPALQPYVPLISRVANTCNNY